MEVDSGEVKMDSLHSMVDSAVTCMKQSQLKTFNQRLIALTKSAQNKLGAQTHEFQHLANQMIDFLPTNPTYFIVAFFNHVSQTPVFAAMLEDFNVSDEHLAQYADLNPTLHQIQFPSYWQMSDSGTRQNLRTFLQQLWGCAKMFHNSRDDIDAMIAHVNDEQFQHGITDMLSNPQHMNVMQGALQELTPHITSLMQSNPEVAQLGRIAHQSNGDIGQIMAHIGRMNPNTMSGIINSIQQNPELLNTIMPKLLAMFPRQ